MELTEDDVLHILKLIDESKFDYFQLEVGELKITVSKGDPIPLASSAHRPPVSQSSNAAVVAAPKASRATPAAAISAAERSLQHRRQSGSRGTPANYGSAAGNVLRRA